LNEIINNDLKKRLRAQNKNIGRAQSVSISLRPFHRRALRYLAKKHRLHGDKFSVSTLIKEALDMYLPTLGIQIESEQPAQVEQAGNTGQHNSPRRQRCTVSL